MREDTATKSDLLKHYGGSYGSYGPYPYNNYYQKPTYYYNPYQQYQQQYPYYNPYSSPYYGTNNNLLSSLLASFGSLTGGTTGTQAIRVDEAPAQTTA